jgi:tetratricopeptide (TPR) repeat protein
MGNTRRQPAAREAAGANWVRKNDLAFVLGFFLLALIVRLTYLFQIESMPVFYHLPGDPLSYYQWAQRIAAGDWLGEGVFYQAPLYPYFLAVVMRIFGSDLWLIRIAQLFFSSAVCGLLSWVGNRLFCRKVGFIAALILCFYAPAIFFGSVIDKTVTDLFFVAVLLVFLTLALERPAPWVFFTSGCTLALLALSRENTLVWAILIPIWTWFYFGSQASAWRMQWMASFALGLVLVLVPVGARNFWIGGQFTLTTSQLGPNFFIGNNPSADGTYSSIRLATGEKQFEQAEARRLAEQAVGRPLSPKEVSAYWLERAMEFIRTEPLKWLRLLGKKWLIVWNVREIEDSDDFYLYQRWSGLLRFFSSWNNFGILAALGALGFVATLNQWRKLWLYYLLIGSFAGSVALFFIFGRYRFPLVPFLCVFAAAGLVEFAALLQRGAWKKIAGFSAVMVLALVFVYWPVVGRPGPSAPGLTYLANGYAKQGQIDAAIQSAQEALEIDPTYGVAHYNLANLYLEKRRTEEAIQHYQQALKVYPRYVDARGNLARALMLSGRLPEAAEQYHIALESQPNEVRVHLGLGEVAILQGRLDQALEHFNAALKIDPSFAPTHTYLARVLAARGELDPAIQHFREALRLEPESAQAHENLARALAERGKNEEAAEHHAQAMRLNSLRR